MVLVKEGSLTVYKNDSFGTASDWLVTILAVIYIVATVLLGNKEMIPIELIHLFGFNIIYSIIIIIVYWVKRKNIIYEIEGNNTDLEKLDSELTSFRKLMLGLSNVPALATIFYLVAKKFILN